jgi:hypothetical protein
MNTVEVKLLKYTYHFKPLTWREEFTMKFDPKKDRLRTELAYALVEVSGLKITSLEDAWKVISPIPDPIINRVYMIYKGGLPEPRVFTTLGLYKAPEPSRFIKRIEQADVEREQVMDRVEQEMERKFGRKELEETLAVEREMAKNSKLRGVTKASEARGDKSK